jgi:hypothetical protein
MLDALKKSRFVGAFSATVLLLGGTLGYRVRFQTPPKDAEPYHRRVHEAADALPFRVESEIDGRKHLWVGENVPMTPGAVELLNPNATVSRVYRDLETGRSVMLLLVQCPDTRDILGHYPKVCYVVHGWTLLSSPDLDLKVDGQTLDGREYEFSRLRLDRATHINVFDVMLLPDGRSCGDMNVLEREAGDSRVRFFGAAQIQIECDASIDAAERREVYVTFLHACKRVIDEVESGLNHE